MATVSNFRSNIGAEALGCPEIVVDEAIVSTILDFCRDTLVWREHLTAINVVANTATYTLNPGTGKQVLKVLNGWHNGLPIYRKSEEDLEDLYDYWPIETGTPKYYTQRTPKDLILVPKPDASLTSGLVVSAAIGPTPGGTDVPDVLYDQYLEEIQSGVLANLLFLQGVPWSNPALAASHRARYEAAKPVVLRRAAQAFGTGRTRTRRNTFF